MTYVTFPLASRHASGRQFSRQPETTTETRCLEKSSRFNSVNAETKVCIPLIYDINPLSYLGTQWVLFIGNDCVQSTGSTTKAYSKTGRQRAETAKTCSSTRRMTNTTSPAQSWSISNPEYAIWRLVSNPF